MKLLLPQIFPIAAPEQYKLHLASWNNEDQPLDVFVRDREEWDGWNRWRGERDDFSRDYIFSLIDFYPEKDRWLFGGAYRVLSRKRVKRDTGYDIELLEQSRPLIGRLKLEFKRPGRAKAIKFENHYKNLIVVEITPEPYSGETFPGYEHIDIGFTMLETICAIQRSDWRTALESVKGIYLITDTSNGKRYVGSAYGVNGIWSRWSCYIETGHGYNNELKKLIAKSGLEHARKFFKFALLEHRPMKTDDETIQQRERYWKRVLLTRGDYGYNHN
jgi:hypothetical protein